MRVGDRKKPGSSRLRAGATTSARAKGTRGRRTTKAAKSGAAKRRAAPRPKAGVGRAARQRKPLAAVALLINPSLAGTAELGEEDTIRSAKYMPREMPDRLFEEERFLFPESYGVNRVRLLVRDPEWLFAYWDVDPKALHDFERQLGERAAALARLTLRITDPINGGSSDILLPFGARWWYVRTDCTRRTYKAELGLILASGEFRRLAESNTVVTPRVGPSSLRASRRILYGQAGEIPPDAGRAVSLADLQRSGAGPWSGPRVDGAAPSGPEKGGASDTFRPGGASDVHRR